MCRDNVSTVRRGQMFGAPDEASVQPSSSSELAMSCVNLGPREQVQYVMEGAVPSTVLIVSHTVGIAR